MRSRSPARSARAQKLDVIVGTTYDGVLIYSKGAIRKVAGKETYYFLVSSKALGLRHGERHVKVLTCPSCGRRALRAVTGSMTFRSRGRKKTTVPDVTRLSCSSCGEQIFDHQANVILDGHRGRRRSRGAA